MLPSKLRQDILREQEKRACERSLMAFVKAAWPIIEPGIQFRDNWHLHAIALHLEALSRGEIQNLVIAVPPGSMKSILVSVAFPAWEWATQPELRVLGASYGIDLAIRDSQRCRDIVTSEWYQQHWGHVQLRAGDDQKIKYSLTSSGWRMATSVGGRATGEHPDRKIVDDAMSALQADSEPVRTTANIWLDRTLSSRGISRGARTVLVAQRFHENDPSGHAVKDLGYEYLCIPMEFDGPRKPTSIGWVDPRKTKGELMWPELFPREKVETLKIALGEFGASGQLQQEPSPGEGGILKTKYFRLWPKGRPLPQLEYVVQSYDTAYTEKTTNDPVACTVWGAFTLGKIHCVMLLDAWDDHLAYPALRKRVLADWSATYGGSKTGEGQPTRAVRADRIIVENKSSGQSLIQDLNQAKVPVFPYNPGRPDKIARAHVVSPLLESGLIFLLESEDATHVGEPRTWAQPFVSQLKKFPKGEHDDYVDSFGQALIYLRDTGWLVLPEAKIAEEPVDRAPTRRENPYGV